MIIKDQRILERLYRREHHAYMELYDSYFRQLYTFAVSVVFDGAVAEDIVQSLFLSLYENPKRLRNDANIGGWLFMSVRNSCFRFLRDRKIEDKGNLLYLQALERSDSLEWIEDRELRGTINNVIGLMPEKCRKVCELRFHGNMKFSEIAQALNISENTARVHVHRAIEKIRAMLSDKSLLIAAILVYFKYF